ncbi:MAG: hypothetical protein WEE89_17815 [Gemmatimonadota bacterium]
MRIRLLVAALAMVLTGAWMLQRQPSGVIPELPAPPPVPAQALKALSGTAAVTLRDVHFTTSLGARVDIPLLEVKPKLTSQTSASGEVRLESVRLVGLRIVAPVDSVHTGINAFMKIPGPRFIIDRVSVVNADVGELADPARGLGRWFYRNHDIDIELRDIDIGGQRSVPEKIRLARLELQGQSKGVPSLITHGAGTVVRTPNHFDVRLGIGFGLTEMSVHTNFARAGGWNLNLLADTIRFSELKAFVGSMPSTGTGKISLSAVKRGDELSGTVRQATAQFGQSRLDVRGAFSTIAGGAAENLVLVVTNLRPDDMKRAFDVDVPDDGPYNGRITASGALRDGMQVNGNVAGSAAGAPSRIALNGLVRVDPDPVFDLEIVGDPIRLADTAFNARLTARGPLSRLGIKGGIELRPAAQPVVVVAYGVQPAPVERVGSASAEVDLELIDPEGEAPRRLSGKALLHVTSTTDVNGSAPVHAIAEGAIVFAKARTVSARVTADSLPLAVLPWPDGIEDVRGFARGDFRIEGALEHPDIQGRIDVQSGAVFIRAANLAITDINGPIRVREERLVIDAFSARAREGTVRVAGEAFVLGENKRVDLTVHGDRLHLIRNSGHEPLYLAGVDLRVTGPLDGARAAGRINVIDAATHRLSGTATGSAILNRSGALDIAIAADSLPLATMPLPNGGLDELSGHVRGRIAVSGTFDDPAVNGAVRLVDAGTRIRKSGTRITDLGGELRIEDGIINTDIRGVATTGTVAVSGSANLLGTRAIDLSLRADSATLTDTDSARVIASGVVSITGTMSQPWVDGRMRLVDGWAKEDLMLKNPVIDPDDPPYAKLAARVPWIAHSDSRLLRREQEEQSASPPFRGVIAVEVTPGMRMIDEDSELYGTGVMLVNADSFGVHATGDVKFLGGFYTNYGERFRVMGGGFRLSNTGEAMIAMRSEHERDLFGGRNQGSASPLEWYPGLEILAHGTTSTASEQARRLSPWRESQTELAALLIYDHVPDPFIGLRNRRFWLPDEKSDLIGERAESQGGPLLWSYIADELYDYLPLSRASLRGGIVTIGSRFPGRIVQGPLFRMSATVSDNLQLFGNWASEGSAWPGVRAELRRGSFSLVAFHEPKFFAAPASGWELPGYFHRRRTGIGLRFESER